MDKLQWFKFSYADWRLGKIQRCPEITQARFINLCCLYWNKEGNLSYEDAEIEIDKSHLDTLISKKVVSSIDGVINISFLDEQLLEIQEVKNDKSKSGVIGNLKRWHPSIFKRFKDKEISLEDAIEESQTIADLSHTDSTPIADQSQTIAEKRREEEKRKDKKREDVNAFSFSKSLQGLGIEKSLVNDFIKNRKLKKLANTETAFKSLEEELKKSNLPINNLMTIIVSNGWGGYKNSWNLKQDSFNKTQQPTSVLTQTEIIR